MNSISILDAVKYVKYFRRSTICFNQTLNSKA